MLGLLDVFDHIESVSYFKAGFGEALVMETQKTNRKTPQLLILDTNWTSYGSTVKKGN